MITAGDVRIEGERKASLSGNSPTKQPRKIMLSTDVERLLHWLQVRKLLNFSALALSFLIFMHNQEGNSDFMEFK